MKNILIITTHQFGYHTDYYNWCYYLKSDFNITYFTFNLNVIPEISMEGIEIINNSVNDSTIKRNFKYYSTLYRLLKVRNFDHIIITEQLLSFIPRFYPQFIFNPKGLIFDIRSVAIFENLNKRLMYNASYKFSTIIYPNCTGITNEIANFYHIPKRKFSILPLGSNIFSFTDKNFDNFDLFYIGVIRSGFEKSVVGFKKFVDTHPNSTYTIIGYKDFFAEDTVEILKKTIDELDLHTRVKFLGRLNHSEAIDYFNNCNVGVSFIPITKYFDNQPPTKNYEYLLSGMACIATNTKANRSIVNNENGIIVDDNAESFAEGLKLMYNRRKLYNSQQIRNSQLSHTWKKIVKDIFVEIIKKSA